MTIELIKIIVEPMICGIVIFHQKDKLNNIKRKHNADNDKRNNNKINVDKDKNKTIIEDVKMKQDKIKINLKDLQYILKVPIR
jgi:hypothetical protein